MASVIGIVSVALRRFMVWSALEDRYADRMDGLPPSSSSLDKTPPRINPSCCHDAKIFPLDALELSSSTILWVVLVDAIVVRGGHPIGTFGESVISTVRSMTVPGAQRHAGGIIGSRLSDVVVVAPIGFPFC